jgi:hypothetical protein
METKFAVALSLFSCVCGTIWQTMTDPSNALQLFQQKLLLHGDAKLQRGVLDQDLFLHVDSPNGIPRYTYVRLEGRIVTALVMFALVEPIERRFCFNIGYAVPEPYRNQGRAKEAFCAALSELQHGLGRAGFSVFYVEAIVGSDNIPSQRVAEQVISSTPVTVTDQISGLSALQYVRRIELPASW